MATTTSNETLISDSQLRGFSAFRERLGYCCCRVWKKTSKYDLSAATRKDQGEEEQRQSTNNKNNKDKEQRERQKKLDRIAQTLPQTTFKPSGKTPTPTKTIEQKATTNIPKTTTNGKKEEITTGETVHLSGSLIRSFSSFQMTTLRKKVRLRIRIRIKLKNNE